jgi:hypothetical protein
MLSGHKKKLINTAGVLLKNHLLNGVKKGAISESLFLAQIDKHFYQR